MLRGRTFPEFNNSSVFPVSLFHVTSVKPTIALCMIIFHMDVTILVCSYFVEYIWNIGAIKIAIISCRLINYRYQTGAWCDFCIWQRIQITSQNDSSLREFSVYFSNRVFNVIKQCCGLVNWTGRVIESAYNNNFVLTLLTLTHSSSNNSSSPHGDVILITNIHGDSTATTSFPVSTYSSENPSTAMILSECRALKWVSVTEL